MSIAAVLSQPPLVARITTFQDGVFADVQSRFIEFHCSVRFAMRWVDPCWCLGVYDVPRGVRSRLAPHDVLWSLPGSDVHLFSNARDPRFILHVAIYEGDADAATRIARCCPHLLSDAAIGMALELDEINIAASLVHLHGPCSGDSEWIESLGRSLVPHIIRRGSVPYLEVLRAFLPTAWLTKWLRFTIKYHILPSAFYIYTFCPETPGDDDPLIYARTSLPETL
ncbi:hypothetical protein SPRG_07144 [Saprolegnia parasitica CBS 223.65]|uniref:Uncharacterized protein n=1 Tax=Saprolegnia parasitica (strain CBS 223.65) TaxID=695850 RepID=A0A067CM21_SAPPC|nr:hypothetical protein SPRG_07144 [Saprolegnia parasitica CBS 223.65]KDO27872.1 hypothetical protein SPRG_07144 [Saprolegnia parasitica CBS 223.65]|eukprot:XP_012201330.1 hypothetical protein SPRG_07144 [Saprolegnia parasitica CBS 223.65]